MSLRYLSLFSGIEAASVAWQALGWQPAAFCEIEPFPNAVLAEHYPDVPNLGDIAAVTKSEIARLGSIDVVIGGSPCQDLSVAGKRAGLIGERSGLFHHQMRLFHAARSFCGARFCVWENVPGAFSSQRGRDFAVVVGAMAGADIGVPRNGWRNAGAAAGRYGLCEWRVLDAQFSDWPSDASACSLSLILETGPIGRRYYLSPTACAGILRRAGKRGKTLPARLEQALAAVADRDRTKPRRDC